MATGNAQEVSAGLAAHLARLWRYALVLSGADEAMAAADEPLATPLKKKTEKRPAMAGR